MNEREALVAMVDAAMVEMRNISPPLRRSECERLIKAALTAQQEPSYSECRSLLGAALLRLQELGDTSFTFPTPQPAESVVVPREPTAWLWRYIGDSDEEWRLSFGADCPTYRDECETLALYSDIALLAAAKEPRK